MKTFTALFCLFAVTVALRAADPAAQTPLKLGPDGFPTGQSTPEGAACDLARAFINRDAQLFTNTCIRLYVGGTGPADYAQFLQTAVAGIKSEAARQTGPPRGPKFIAKVFAARHFTKNGPAAYGYATYGFQDVMFVDVGVVFYGGKQKLNRTMVIQDKNGRWYVHPVPNVSPYLSVGLNEESPSTRVLSEAYPLPQPK